MTFLESNLTTYPESLKVPLVFGSAILPLRMNPKAIFTKHESLKIKKKLNKKRLVKLYMHNKCKVQFLNL